VAEPVRHGEYVVDLGDLAALDGDDPALALVHADMGAWLAAHPCRCDVEGEPCQNCNPGPGDER
jgi:hypothetical protein